jgi:hypothetical protein
MEEDEINFAPDPAFLGSLANLLAAHSSESVPGIVQPDLSDAEAVERPLGEAEKEGVDGRAGMDLHQRSSRIGFERESSAQSDVTPKSLVGVAASALSWFRPESSVSSAPERNASETSFSSKTASSSEHRTLFNSNYSTDILNVAHVSVLKRNAAGVNYSQSDASVGHLGKDLASERVYEHHKEGSISFDTIPLAIKVPPPPRLGPPLELADSDADTSSSDSVVEVADPFRTDVGAADEPGPPGEDGRGSKRRKRSSGAASPARRSSGSEAARNWEQQTEEFLSRIGASTAAPVSLIFCVCVKSGKVIVSRFLCEDSGLPDLKT